LTETTDKGSAYRSEVIEGFILLEAIVDCFINTHYMGKPSMAFHEEVLYDEYFSFGLKVRIVEKVLDSEEKTVVQSLRRVNNIRNLFAHCGMLRYESGEVFAPNPRKLDKKLDFEALYAEFMERVPILQHFFAKRASKEGAEMLIVRKGRWEPLFEDDSL